MEDERRLTPYIFRHIADATPLGFGKISYGFLPKGVPSGQPWAIGCNGVAVVNTNPLFLPLVRDNEFQVRHGESVRWRI